MNLAREIQNLNKLIKDMRAKEGTPKQKRGAVKHWVLKNVPAKHTKTADFIRRGEAAGFNRASVYFAVIRLIDEGAIAEDRYWREIWRP